MRLTPEEDVFSGDAVPVRQTRLHRALATAQAFEDEMPKGTVKIEVERCKACGFCVEFCPSHVLALSSAFNSKGYHPPHVVDPEKCSGCDLCGMYCPDFAIFGKKVASKEKSETSNEG